MPEDTGKPAEGKPGYIGDSYYNAGQKSEEQRKAEAAQNVETKPSGDHPNQPQTSTAEKDVNAENFGGFGSTGNLESPTGDRPKPTAPANASGPATPGSPVQKHGAPQSPVSQAEHGTGTQSDSAHSEKDTKYTQTSYEQAGQDEHVEYPLPVQGSKKDKNAKETDTVSNNRIIKKETDENNKITKAVIESERKKNVVANSLDHQKNTVKSSYDRRTVLTAIAAGAAATAAAAVSEKNTSSVKKEKGTEKFNKKTQHDGTLNSPEQGSNGSSGNQQIPDNSSGQDADKKNLQNTNTSVNGFVTLKDLQEELGTISLAEANTIKDAINKGNADLSLTDNDIANSFTIVNQSNPKILDMQTTSEQYQIPEIHNFGFGKITSAEDLMKTIALEADASRSLRLADVGAIASRQGNQITVFVNDRPKQFTIRPGGTVNVNGLLMNVYDMGANRVFVGWKDAIVDENIVTVASKITFKIVTGPRLVKNTYGLALEIKGDIRAFSDKVAFLKSKSIRQDIVDTVDNATEIVKDIKNDISSSVGKTKAAFGGLKNAMGGKKTSKETGLILSETPDFLFASRDDITISLAPCA